MTSWNPITSFIGIARVGGSDSEASLGSARASDFADGHRPLGFIDVRSEVTTGSASSSDGPDTESTPMTGAIDVEHHSTPGRAHDLPLEVDADDLSWPVAEVESSSHELETSGPDDALLEVEEPDVTSEPGETADEKVPFFKREISFGRRKSRTTSVPVVDLDTESEIDPTEGSDGDRFDEVVAVEAPIEPVSFEETVAAEAPQNEDPEADAADDNDPEVETAEPVAEETSNEEPIVDAPVPVVVAEATKEKRGSFRKRDISFGRSKAERAGASGRGAGRTVGLEIGASQIAAAVIVDNQGRKELAQLERMPIEPGVVVDGEVRDTEGLSNLLRSFFEEHKLPRRDIRVGLASNRIGVRTLDIVGVDDEERFANAVRFKAHEVLPMAMQESTLDYRVVGERLNEAGESIRRVLLAVAPRDQVSPYVEAAAGAGLSLAAVDLEALGLLRTFVDPTPVGAAVDAATVVVNIGHESSILLVAGNGALRVHARLRVGRHDAADCDRAGARGAPGRGSDDPSSRLAGGLERTPARDARGRCSAPSGRGHPAPARAVRPRARLLASVLPDPARLARDRGDHHHGRHERARGSRRDAPPDHRRTGPCRRSAGPHHRPEGA